MTEPRSNPDPVLRRARELYRSGAARDRTVEPVDDEAVVDLVSGRLSGDERRRVADAVAADPRLADRVRELMEIQDTTARLDAKAGRSFRDFGLRHAGLVAATLVVVAWAGWSLTGDSGAGALRSSDAAAPTAITIAGPAEELRLSWEPVPEARHYRVALYDEASTPLWESPTTERPTTVVPDEVRAGLETGRTYLWRVFVRRGVEESGLPLSRLRLEE